MKIQRKHMLSIAMLIAAAASPMTALASDQPGAPATSWFEESQFPGATGFSVFSSNSFYHDAGMALATANMTRGAGPLTTIGGPNTRNNACLNNNADVDIYCITITDPTNFSAVTSGSASRPDLYLFKANGTAVAGYQAMAVNGAATLAAGVAAGAFSPGDIAYLAITRDQSAAIYNHPMNDAFQEIFSATAGLVFPLGGAIDSHLGLAEGPSSVPGNWTDSGNDASQAFAQSYTITLAGAGFSTTPAPGAAGLLGLGGLVALRRRRA